MEGFDSVEQSVRLAVARVARTIRRVAWRLARSAYWVFYAAATAFLLVLLALAAPIVDPTLQAELPFAVESTELLVDAAIGAGVLFAAASVASWVSKALTRALEVSE